MISVRTFWICTLHSEDHAFRVRDRANGDMIDVLLLGGGENRESRFIDSSPRHMTGTQGAMYCDKQERQGKNAPHPEFLDTISAIFREDGEDEIGSYNEDAT